MGDDEILDISDQISGYAPCKKKEREKKYRICVTSSFHVRKRKERKGEKEAA